MIFVIENDDLYKAIGDQRANHKYWRRVPRGRDAQGRMRYNYYYDNETSRKKYAEDKADYDRRRAKFRANKREAEEMAEHRTQVQFEVDFPPLRQARMPLKKLNTEYLGGLWGGKHQLRVIAPEEVAKPYHEEISSYYGGAEPDDIMGLPQSVFRSLEMALQRLPSGLREAFDGTVSAIEFKKTSKDSAGRCHIHGDGTSTIDIDPEKVQSAGVGRGPHLRGGTWATDAIMHEIGHALLNRLDNNPPKGMEKLSEQWEKFYKDEAQREAGVTGGAEIEGAGGAKNSHERFAESFAAALLYPKQLAHAAPVMYEWMRDFIGHETMLPLTTETIQGFPAPRASDRRKWRAARKALEVAGRKDDAGEAFKQAQLAEHYGRGIMQTPEDSTKLTWWKQPETKVQALLRTEPDSKKAPKGSVYTHPKDKFYEMHRNGRMIYMRIGKSGPDKDFSGWNPDSVGDESKWDPNGTGRYQLGANEIKEVYDADGNALSTLSAMYYLEQDELPDEPPPGWKPQKGEMWNPSRLIAFDKAAIYGPENERAVDARQIGRKMADMTHKVMKVRRYGEEAARGVKGADKLLEAAKKAVDEIELLMPVEIDETTFRQRSGTFVFDRWEAAGEDLVQAIASLPAGSAERIRLEKEYLKLQPNTAFKLERDARGRVIRRVPIIDFTAHGKANMRMHTIRYRNPNPDGTYTEIECERQLKGPHAGAFHIANPVWRALLTPNNEPIRKASDLKKLCADAATLRRRIWVSVRTRTSGRGQPNYLHLQVEFDGRGSPLLVGHEWKRMLGSSEPRLDMLLDRDNAGNPLLKGETIRPSIVETAKPRKIVEEMVESYKSAAVALAQNPNANPDDFGGELIVINTRNDEIRGKEGRQVAARLESILPAKKAGEVPSPPGWDRMPETVSEYLPFAGTDGKKKPKLRQRERELIDRGLLPGWYAGTNEQRDWLRKVYEPAYEQWQLTLAKETARTLPERFVFWTAAGLGMPGRKIVRYGRKELLRDIEGTKHSSVPDPLKHNVLAYMYKDLHAATGDVKNARVRLLMPRDGSVTFDVFSIPGATVDKETGTIDISLNSFAQMRNRFGMLNMTDDVRRAIEARAEEVREAARSQVESHALDLVELDAEYAEAHGGAIRMGKLIDKGVHLQRVVKGRTFTLPRHQIGGMLKALDNGGRWFWTHWMGTGKTITGLSTIKVMQSDMWGKIAKKKPLGRTIVLSPLSVISQWRDACFDFNDGCKVIGAASDMTSIDTYLKSGATDEILLVGPEYFTRNWEKFLDAEVVIDGKTYKGLDLSGLLQDEAHKGSKNENSKLAKILDKVQERFAELEAKGQQTALGMMTGTPMTRATSDVKEYITTLSGGKIWGDMTTKEWERLYCDESTIPQDVGLTKKEAKGERLTLKPTKIADVAATLSQYMDIAMSKDVKGKMLPAVRINETEFEEMVGTQALLYASKISKLSDSDRSALEGRAGLSREEEGRVMSGSGGVAIQQAKAIANNPAYKAASEDLFVKVTRKVAQGEESDKAFKDESENWIPFDPQWLLDRPDITNAKVRRKLAGLWPTAEELGDEITGLYNLHMHKALREMGVDSYEQLSGTQVTTAQLNKIARKEGGKWVRDTIKWPSKVINPEEGPLGIICRGSDTIRATDPELWDRAQKFQREFRAVIKRMVPPAWPGDAKAHLSRIKELVTVKGANVQAVLDLVSRMNGISADEGQRLLGTRSTQIEHHDTVSWGEGKHKVTVPEGKYWVSDKRGSLHLPFRKEDWDRELNKPKSAGGFEIVKDGDRVEIPERFDKQFKPKFGAKPKDMTKEEWEEEKRSTLAEWEAPSFKYNAALGEKGDKVALIEENSGETVWVSKREVKARVLNLLDPGMRAERHQFDIVNVVGNAKAESIMNRIEELMRTSDRSEGNARQFIIFGGGILESCRVAESVMRLMGFKDVNEALQGSREYDPSDPNPGNGYYYVTYIGSNYTGTRELNSEVFKKMKDRRNRDSYVSVFVDRCMEGRSWAHHADVQLSQWSADARVQIFQQFKIQAPEAYFVKDGVQSYFYGTPHSHKILKEIEDIGNIDRLPKDSRAAAQKRVDALAKEYHDLVEKNAIKTPPLDRKQMTVFNNTVGMVASDAANTGMNWGNAPEMINYDSLSSPMSEWQRMTRAARLLPDPIPPELIQRPDGSLGPVGKLMEMEHEIFGPVATMNVTGTVLGMEIDGTPVGGEIDFNAGLLAVAEYARNKASAKKTREAWQMIAAKAEVAATLGGEAARMAFTTLKQTPVPGGTRNVIDFERIGSYTDVTKGTYGGRTAIKGPVAALTEAINQLTETERTELLSAHLYQKDAAKKQRKSLDPTEVYLAIRGMQVMLFVQDQLDVVGAEMRTAAGGAVVQSSDVVNKIIDGLTPMDRAVIKESKFLVNVTRLGVAAEVPSIVKVGPQKVFTGYERQNPIIPEARVRAIGRSRFTAIEEFLQTVQDKTPIRTDLDMMTVDASAIESTSKVQKSFETDLFLEL